MKRVLVTGSSGYLGRLLTERLIQYPLVSQVVGLDLLPANQSHPKFKPIQGDIRDEFLLRSIMQENDIDTVFHLAYPSIEMRDQALARAVSVEGSLTVLEAANKSPGVRRIIITSSASAYGARRDNPKILREEDPLRAATLNEGVGKRAVEMELTQAMSSVRQSLQVVILRLCAVAGAASHHDDSIKLLCRLPVGVSVLFHRGAFQFLHEEDLLEVMLKALQAPEMRGVYNVAPDDSTSLREFWRSLGKWRIGLPYSLLWILLFFLRRLGGRSALDENLVSYLAYPVVLSNHKIKNMLGVRFARGSLESFLECARDSQASAENSSLPVAASTAETVK